MKSKLTTIVVALAVMMIAPATAKPASSLPNGVHIEWNHRFGTPETILKYGAALTKPAKDPVKASRDFLANNKALFGWAKSDVDNLETMKTLVQPNNGPKEVLLHQTFDGLHGGAYGGSILVALDHTNRILSVRANVLRAPTVAKGVRIPAALAVAKAGGLATPPSPLTSVNGWSRFGKEGIGLTHYARLAAFPTSTGEVRPIYEIFFSESEASVWHIAVDAINGTILSKTQNVDSFAPEGRVFLNYPGAPAGGKHQMVSFRGDKVASPAGWLNPITSTLPQAGAPVGNKVATTVGNNAYTATHWISGTAPDGPGQLRPVSADGIFDEPFTDAWRTSDCGYLEQADMNVQPSYTMDAMPAVLNLFFHHNVMHDFWYNLGFDQTAGAMQVNNFGQAGLGEDPLIGLVQSGGASSRNNAFMNSLPDGVPSYSAMFVWEPGTRGGLPPCVDGDFDAAVIYHEYTHGVTNRYVGGEWGNLNGLQGGSMGEAWSDYFALDYLNAHNLETKTALGPYVTGDAQRGIRNWAADEVKALYGDIGYDGGPEVHSDGEIWTGLLWDLRTTLGEAVQDGERYATQIVADGMPIAGPSPSMLNMRDAILAADFARSGDDVLQDLIWSVFARHGMGFSAKSNGAGDTSPREAFDVLNEALNGRVNLRMVDSESGKPLWGAEVVGGTVEASAPLAAAGTDGLVSLRMAAGLNTMTVRLRGYGSRVVQIPVTPGESVNRTLALSPNYASSALGGKTAATMMPLIDDSRFTSAALTPGEAGQVTISLAGVAPVDVREVRVSAGPGGSALDKFKVFSSTDGENFKQLVGARLGRAHRPFAVGIQDIAYRSWRMAKPVRATHIRLVPLTPQIAGATINVSEIQVFGSGDRFAVTGIATKTLTDDGMLTVSLPLFPGLTDVLSPTMNYMAQNCGDLPPTNGIDAWVTEVPDGFAGARIKAEAPDVGGQDMLPEFDVYFLDKNCQQIGFIASPDPMPHETGPIASGTKWIVTLFFAGPPSTVKITASAPTVKFARLGAPAKRR